jgi:hypothetical protein
MPRWLDPAQTPTPGKQPINGSNGQISDRDSYLNERKSA